MSHFEKDAIISGLGISRVGRRTGIPGLELTLEAARAAIDDAGLTTSDIDGIASLGDIPLAEVTTALGIDVPDRTSGFDTGGLLTPVMSACHAVAEKRARHVLVYRTVLMLGGTMTESPSSSGPNPLANPPSEPHTP
ncbi:thiolase family protein, partial [Mycolicibacterium elephantis]